jgi:hypothetical protein
VYQQQCSPFHPIRNNPPERNLVYLTAESSSGRQVRRFRERVKLGVYVVLWLFVIFYRTTDLAFIAILAQIIFSEQIASRWARLEWLRVRCERIYDELYRACQTKADLKIISLEYLGLYEMAKATAAISLSTSIFDNNREIWNREWDQIRSTLNV